MNGNQMAKMVGTIIITMVNADDGKTRSLLHPITPKHEASDFLSSRRRVKRTCFLIPWIANPISAKKKWRYYIFL